MLRPLFRKQLTRGAVQFYIRHPQNLLLVKKQKDGGVLVCATADNLSTEQRAAFVCYLRAEGFASAVAGPLDRWFEPSSDQEGQPVRWIVDPSWSVPDPLYVSHLRRLCWCIAGTMMVWLALVAALVCELVHRPVH